MHGHEVRRLSRARLLAHMLNLAAALAPVAGAVADAPDFRVRPLLAGKASLTGPGFVVRRDLGVANIAPELRLPVELVYSSANERLIRHVRLRLALPAA